MYTLKLVLVFLAMLSFSFSKMMGQNKSEQMLKVVPPSPNVASLGKYGEVPVSLYTGIPNISIPLYEIKDGNLDLPITLSYHAGGVKVEEMASSVGLSWTLNAGGVLGRNVRGLPDEVGPWYPQPSANTIESIYSSGNSNAIQQLVKDVDRGDRDGEADIYYYNFNQFSGKFFYDQAGNVHTLPTKNILINPIAGGWKIIAEDGSVYTFIKPEEVRSADCSGDQSNNTAWFLTSIRSADGKREISFTYEALNFTYETLMGQTKYFSTNSTGSTCLSNHAPCLGTQNYYTYRLVRIDFGDGYINFNYNTQRCDLLDDKSLDEIKVYSKNNHLIKGFRFRYSYFGNNSDGCNFLSKNLKRLKLVSISEENESLQKPPYTFEYNESIELPSRLSYAQDHWGYYNGKINNFDLIASFSTVVFSGNQITFPGADRSANPETAQAGMLTKIKYPTGGETSFTFESNTVSDKQVESHPQTTERILNFVANETTSRLPNPYVSNELVIPEQGAQVQFHISGFPVTLWQGCDYIQCSVIRDNNPTPFMQIGNSWDGATATWAAGVYKLRLSYDCTIDAFANFSVTISAQIPTTVKPTEIRPVGGVRIKQIEDNPGNGDLPIVKTYKYHPENDINHSSGALVNFPDYGYDLSVENIKRDEFGSPVGHAEYCTYRVRQSFSNYPLATTQGSYVGYKHVIVDFGENGESWYSFNINSNMSQNFPFAPNDDFDWSRGFMQGTKDFMRKNGTLLIVKETRNTPYSFNHFKIQGIKTGRDYYNIDNGQMIPHLQLLPKYSFYLTTAEAYVLGQTKERIYDQKDPSKFIETVTDYTYSPHHLQLIQSKTATSQSNESVIEEIVSNKKYPFDYSFSGTPSGNEALGIKNLQDLHAVNSVIEEYEIKQERDTTNNKILNQRIVSGGITTYKSNKPYPDQLLKLEIGAPVPLADFANGSIVRDNTFIKNNSYKPAVLFNSYDDNGNVTTQQKPSDIKKSYIWGYNSQYPIAEVVGLDYSTIMANVGLNQVILQSATTSDEQMRTELDKIRTSFPTAFVTTYTYKPLIGISSLTDINNRTTYYEYDSFGRLILIRDQDKNILKKICYNYAGQQESCAVTNISP
ncbi:MAG: hypothetical protein ABIN89_08180 [Chitinophagaceae bacterium]